MSRAEGERSVVKAACSLSKESGSNRPAATSGGTMGSRALELLEPIVDGQKKKVPEDIHPKNRM